MLASFFNSTCRWTPLSVLIVEEPHHDCLVETKHTDIHVPADGVLVGGEWFAREGGGGEILEQGGQHFIHWFNIGSRVVKQVIPPQATECMLLCPKLIYCQITGKANHTRQC